MSKASQVELDVSERSRHSKLLLLTLAQYIICRQLKLSYSDVYELCVPLPYPVFDSKAVAKFDKTTKALTLTLPVKPQQQQQQQQPPEVLAAVVEERTDDQATQKVNLNEKQSKKLPGKDHSRWVASHTPPGQTESLAADQSDPDLASYVKRQADLALQQAKTAAVSSPNPAVSSPPIAPAPASPAVVGEPGQVGLGFQPSSKYTGSRQGYVFKMDSLGLGYYLDVVGGGNVEPSVPPPPALLPPATTPPISRGQAEEKMDNEANVVVSACPPIVLRQTRSALALLVQVRYILKESG